MCISVKNTKIYIDYWFVLVLSVSALFKANQVLEILLYSSLHELGHLFALLILGKLPYLIKFSYYGFAMKYDDNISRKDETIVLLFGPLVNLALFLLFGNYINLILFALNFLPVFPLDFGRVLRLYLPRISRYISIVFLILICIFCVFMVIYYKSFSLLPVVFYLVIYSLNFE